MSFRMYISESKVGVTYSGAKSTFVQTMRMFSTGKYDGCTRVRDHDQQTARSACGYTYLSKTVMVMRECLGRSAISVRWRRQKCLRKDTCNQIKAWWVCIFVVIILVRLLSYAESKVSGRELVCVYTCKRGRPLSTSSSRNSNVKNEFMVKTKWPFGKQATQKSMFERCNLTLCSQHDGVDYGDTKRKCPPNSESEKCVWKSAMSTISICKLKVEWVWNVQSSFTVLITWL